MRDTPSREYRFILAKHYRHEREILRLRSRQWCGARSLAMTPRDVILISSGNSRRYWVIMAMAERLNQYAGMIT